VQTAAAASVHRPRGKRKERKEGKRRKKKKKKKKEKKAAVLSRSTCTNVCLPMNIGEETIQPKYTKEG
jgi:hypothetical protein